MPTVIVPPLARDLTDGGARVTVPGKTVREVVHHLEAAFPGFAERLLDGDDLKPTIVAIVDGSYSEVGLLKEVGEDSEITFVTAMAGG